MTLSRRNHLAVFLLTFWSLQFAVSESIASPSISFINLRGLQIGGTTRLLLEGDDLTEESYAVLPFPILQQESRLATATGRLELSIRLGDEIQPGIYWLRIVNKSGPSDAILIGVNEMPQTEFVERVTQLPISMHGRLPFMKKTRTSLVGVAGQRVVIDLESHRIGSQLNPVIRLLDEQGKQLAHCQRKQFLQGDARIDVLLPKSGRYFVELSNLSSQPVAENFFRLSIGDFHYADHAFPPAVRSANRDRFILGTAFNFDRKDGTDRIVHGQLPHLNMIAGWTRLDVPNGVTTSGHRPRVYVSHTPEVLVEDLDPSAPWDVTSHPLGINGRFNDRKTVQLGPIKVQPNSELKIQTWAQRIGSALDGVLQINDLKGRELAVSDDQATTIDPGLTVKIPDGTDAINLLLRDLHGRHGSGLFFRIEVVPEAAQDFRLMTPDDTCGISIGGSNLIEISVERLGYQGPIELMPQLLPSGLESRGGLIPAGADKGWLSLTATKFFQATGFTIFGRAMEGPADSLLRPVLIGEMELDQPTRFQKNKLLVFPQPPAKFQVSWNGLTENQPLLLGGTLLSSVQVTNQTTNTGPIQFELLTTQKMPRKKIKIRNEYHEVDDLESALRFERLTEFEKIKDQFELPVLVPGNLPVGRWGLAIKAQLMSRDRNQILAESTSRALYFDSLRAIELELTSDKRSLTSHEGSKRGTFRGKIRRADRFNEPVSVSLIDLPPGVTSPVVEVPPNEEKFVLVLKFPDDAVLPRFTPAKLVATSYRGTDRKSITARSNPVRVYVKIEP